MTKELFKKTLIVFWTLWWIIALWTDVVGLLAHNQLLQASWAPDINYPNLLNALKIYHPPSLLVQFLFAGVLVWSLISTLIFCWASLGLRKPEREWMRRADLAFIVSICFWLAFFLADQIVMKFDLEENHMVQGGFQLLSYLTLYLLPSLREGT